jgi:hypothetical protein
MKLKIGRHEYEITGKDKFLDNGKCIQLMTQNKNNRDAWGRASAPVLSQKAIRELLKYDRVGISHKHGEWIKMFRLDIE